MSFETARDYLVLVPSGNSMVVRQGRNQVGIGDLDVQGPFQSFSISGSWPQGYIAVVTCMDGRTTVFEIDSGLNISKK